MTVTSSITQNNQPARIAQGRYEDTAVTADAEFDIGFIPRYVRVVNEVQAAILEWSEGMPDGLGIKYRSPNGAAISIPAAGNGITPRGRGIKDETYGFTLGQDGNILSDNEPISWYAHD